MSKWISVKNKLPDKDGSYLCFRKVKWSNIGYMEVCEFALNLEKVDKYDFYRKRRSGWYGYDGEYGYYEHDNITHWQPAPEPPKERSNNDD